MCLQNFFWPSTYQFDLGLFCKSVSPLLDRQPIEIMSLVNPLLIDIPEGSPPDLSPLQAAAAATQAAAAAAAAAARKGKANYKPYTLLLPQNPKDKIYLWRFQLLHEHLLA